MADRIAELYQIASKKGVLAEGLTEDMFREQTKTDEGLRSFYDYAKDNGMKLTPWKTFRGKARGEIMDNQPAEAAQPAQPAGVSGDSLLDEQAELARQNAIQGATNDPNHPFVAPQTTQPIQGRELKMDEVVRPQGYENLSDEELNAQIAQLTDNVHEQKARELYKARYGKDYVEPEEPTSWWDKYGYGQKGMQYRAEKQRYAEAYLDASRIAESEDPGNAKRRNEQVATIRQEQAYRNQQEAMPKLGDEIKDLQQRILTNEKQDGVDMRGAKHLLNQTIDLYNAPSKYGRGKGVVNWGKGLADQITDYDTWTAGVTELARYGNLNGIVNKMNKNEKLTKEEELLLETFLMSIAVQDMRSDLSTGYEIGKGAAESIPFMVEMYLTAGAGAAAKRGLVQLAERKVGQAFAEKLARSLGGTVIRDAAGHMVERGATRTVAGKVGKTLAYDFTQTAVMPSTYANIYKDRVSEVLQGDGNYGFMDLARSFTGQMVETGTERWGGRIIDRGMSKMIPIDATALWGKNKLFGHFVENYINSPIGETGEEVIAAGVNTLRSFNPLYSNVDEKSVSSNQRLRGELGEMLSPEGLGKTFLIILPMSVFGGGANAAINRMAANAVAKDYGQSRQALQGLLQSSGATEEEASRIVSQIEASDSDRAFFDKMNMTYNNLLNKYMAENPNAPIEDVKAYQQQLDKVLGDYTKQAGAYNQMVGDLMEKYEKLPEEEKRNVDSAMEEYMVRAAEEFASKQQPQDRQAQLRQQATEAAQHEVYSISHQDGNVYYVGIKGKEGAEGYAVSGNLDMQQDDKGMYGTRGRDLVTVKMNDGSVEQVPADELVVRDLPVSANELMQEKADHLFAQYANNDLFQIGDKVHIMQNGQPSEDSSTIVNITDEGVEVEVIDPNGQPNTTIIPHEQAAEMLSKDETGTEDGIVTFNTPDGELRLRQTADGVYETIAPPYAVFEESDLANMGAVRADQPAAQEAPTTPQEATAPEQTQAYPQDEEGNPAWGQIEVPQAAQILYDTFKQNNAAAISYADDQLKEAEKVQKKAASQKSHSLNIAQRIAEDEQNAQFKAAADAAVKYWNDVKLAIGQIKTAEEQAAQAAQQLAMQQAREQRSKTEEGTTANATMAERYNAAPKIIGNAGTTTLPDGRELAGHYVLIAPEGVTASHNAADNFRRSEGYPVTADGQSINDRDYTADKEEQQKVVSIAQNFNGNAIKNMPVISDEGLVYNGNGRMMAGQLAALNGTDAAYTQSLMNNAAQYGFTPEQVASIPHARVVFQLDERLPYSTQSLAIFNEQETQTQSNTGKAAGYARKLTPQAVSEVLAAVDGFNTIDAFFSDKKAPFNLINSLINAGIIAQREKAEMVDGDKLSATGRERLSNILFGTVFDNETIRLMGDDAALKNSIMRALPQILDNKSLGEFSLEADINDAIRLLYEVRRAGVPFQSFVRQTVMSEDGEVHTAAENYSPYQLLLAEEMTDGGVDAFRDVLNLYNEQAKTIQGGQMDIFGDLLTPTELKNLILQRYGKEPTETERPSAGRQTDNAPASAPASNEPAAEVTEPEKIVPERPNSKQLQGMSYNVAEAEDMLGRMVRNILDENGYEDVEIVGTKVIGSRVNGNAREDSDLDCLIEFKGNAREDSLFNLFEEQGIELDGVKVDINPITEGKSGTIEQFMRRSDEYLAEKAATQALYDALAQAEAETDTNPTDAQKKAENYKQGHVTLWGLPITIENPKGSIRRGTDANGKQWEQEMHHTYGKIRRTEGVDGDHIDVFIGPNLTSDKVFVVDQRNVDTGEFDEHKVMLGFDSLEDAQNGYLSNYEEGWQGMGTVTEVTMDEFKKWIDSSTRKTKPFAEYKSVKIEGAASTAMEEQPDITNDSAQEFIGKDISNVRKALGHWWTLDSQNVSGNTNYYFFERAGYGRLQVITDNNNKVKSVLFSAIKPFQDTKPKARTTKKVSASTAIAQKQISTPESEGNLTPLEAAQKRKAAREAAKAEEPKNTIFTDEAYEAAKARMKARLNRLNMGIDPEMVADQIVIAGYHVERGARKFADFARALIADFGDGIRQYARQMYNYLRDIPEGEQFRAEMDDYATVMAFDIDNFDFKDRMMPAVREYEDVNGQKVVIDDVVKGRDGTVYYELTITEPSGHVRQTSLSVDDFNKELGSKGIFPANSKENAQKNEENAENILINQNNLVTLQPNEKEYAADGLSVVVNTQDYTTYLTPQAKEVFAKLGQKERKPHNRPELSYISFASRDGVMIPLEVLKSDPAIIEAQAKIDSNSGSLELTQEQIEEYANRLLEGGDIKSERKAFIIIGRPAGGKSSVFAEPLAEQNSARIIDSDEVKPWLDGYDNGDGAGYVQKASDLVMQEALWRAALNGDNVVIPKIGGGSIIDEITLPLKELGYTVELYYNEVAPESSYMRAMARFAEKGRYLSLNYLAGIGDKPTKTFNNYSTKDIYGTISELSSQKVQDLRARLARIREMETRLLSERLGRGGRSISTLGISELLESGEPGRGRDSQLTGTPLFDHYEWKNNDVPFGTKPKTIKQGDNVNSNNNNGSNEENSGRVPRTPRGISRSAEGQRDRLGEGDSVPSAVALGELLKGKSAEEQHKLASEWAKEHGALVDFPKYASENGLSVFANGNENDNWVDTQANVVYKMNNLMNSADKIANLIERVELYDEIFPETKLSLWGFSSIYGSKRVHPIYTQQFIDNAEHATQEQIDDLMRSKGFEPTGNREGEYSNGQYVVSDALPKNAMRTNSGIVFVIDADVKRAGQGGGGKKTIFEKGQKVKYKNKVDGKLYDATIDSVNADGTYNLLAPNPVFGDVFMGNISEDRISPIEQPKEEKPVSPMMKQFQSIKEQYPDATLMFRVGDFYELYEEDAVEASKILGINLVKRKDGHTFAGFPFHALDTYLPKLVRAGWRVAICDQLEDPKLTTKTVKRGVTELVETPKVESQEVAEPESVTDNQEPTIPEPNVVTDTVGEITESKHTKTGNPIWIVKPMERVGNDEFRALRKRAKENNGYYSTFVKGYVFNSVNDANRFNNISDVQTTTEQTSANTEAVISQAETVAATAETIETPEQVAPEVTPKAKEEQVTEVQQVIEQVDDAVEQINEQLAVLGYYEADTDDPSKWNESYGFIRSAEAKALKDIDRLAKQLAADLGIEVNKRKKIASANLAPAGGDISFRLPLSEDGKELYLTIDVAPNESWRVHYNPEGSEYDLVVDGLMWRVEDTKVKGFGRYLISNQIYREGPDGFKLKYQSLVDSIRRQAKDYLPKVEEASAPVEHMSDLLEEAKKRKAASDKRKKDKTRIPDGQQVLSLFDDAVEDLTEAARQEEQLNDNNNGNINESTEGAGRTTPEGVNEVGSNGTESDGGQQTGTAQGTSGSRNTGRVAGSDAGQNGGETQQPTATGTEQPRSKRGSASGTTGGVSSGDVLEDPTVEHGDRRADDGSLRTPKEKNTPKNTRNYLYPEDAGEIDNMSPMERLETNVEALEVLRTLLTEEREATPEERATLGKLRGWGGINVPDNYTAKYTPLAMNPLQKRLVAVVNALDPNGDRKLLDSLRTASLTSYYTPIPIARAMHAIAEQAGYKGNGNMLDPSMGNGVFEGSMAKGVQQSTNIRGVELDWLTGQIAQKLYPDARINITGFQDAHIPQDYYDYVVSNIPFGSLQITDLDWQKNPSPIRKAAQGKIHNYFAVKMIESTRPGGLCVIMTSNAIMDTMGNQMIRQYITENCEVLGAIRLPNNTFKGAGTRVVTDVIYLRKFRNVDDSININDNVEYANKIKAFFENPQLNDLPDGKGGTKKVRYNSYFMNHAENVIGTPVAGGQYTDDAYDQESDLTTDEIAKKIEEIGRRFIEERKKRFGNAIVGTPIRSIDIKERIKERYVGNGKYEDSGNIVVMNGLIGKLETVKDGNVKQLMFAEQKLGSATVAQVTDYANLRSLLKQLIHVQIENYTSDRIDEVRKQMQQAYTAYTKKYGKLCEKKNAFIEEDIDGYQVRALEQWKDGKFVGMADIYTKNTIASERDMNDVSDPQAAVLNSLAEYGNINTEYLQRVLGDNFAEDCKGLIFEDPSHQGEYIARDVYLSGDVVTKLEYARQMAEEDSRFQDNVTALEAIQPKRKEFGEFPCHMGARWIPVQIYNDFLNEIFGIRGNWKGQKTGITYVEATNEYIFNFDRSEFGGNAAKYATSRKSASDIFQAALLDKDITVKYKDEDGKEHTDQEATDAARDKVAELREAFEDWVPQKPERVQQLTDTYNSVFNRHVLPTYNGQHLNIVGLQGMKLRPHQKDAVWRIINQRGGIVDHIVGAGKSLVMQASIMEMRRMGIAKKPMILALKSTTQQIANEFRQAFPAARVLAPTEADFSTQNRKRFLAQIAVNDYDCIILSHEQYSALDHTEAIKRSFIEDQIAQLDNLLEYLYGQKDESQLTKKQIKGLEKRKENLKERLKKLELIRTDEEFVFENLGVDYLFVDECQAFKNLMFQTSYSQIAGLGNPEGSERSTKLLYGVRALQEMHQGDMGTVFLSGTTITNSLSELYNIFNYLRPNEMARMGLNTFDAWASTFAVRSTEAEFGATNELKEKSRFRKFEGLQELSRLYTEIADVRNDNNLELPKPKLHTVFVSIPISDTMKKINDAITDMVKNHNGSFFNINPANDYKYPWSLSATNLAKLATLSPKLIDPSYDDENGKIFHVCENIKKIYDQFNDQKGVQLVFCDAGVPGPGKKYDAYTDIIRRLTKDYGIPRSEIADIHEAGDDAKRQALFKKVNEGKVRIVIGGTKNMGTGVNVQQRVVAMHHLDIPWTPADVNQRNGRGSRQGNEIARDYNNNQVDAYYYAVERTLDTYRYQLQDVKGKMIDSFKMANVGVNEFDEGGGDDNMSPAEMVAILSGNPVILDKAKQDKLVDKLKRLQRSSVTEYARRKSEYELLQKSQSTMQDLIRRNAEDIETLKRNGYEPDAEGNWPTLHPVLSEYERVSSGKTFEKPTELGAAIHARIKETGTAYLYAAGISAKVMPYIDANGETKLGEYELQAQTYSGVRYTVKLSDDDTAAGQAMQNLLRKIYSNAEVYKHRLEEVNNKLEGADPGEYSFPRQAELDAALAKKREIDAEYNKLIVSDKKPKLTDTTPEAQIDNLDYPQFANQTEAQQLATAALVEVLNDNTDLDVFLASDEEAQDVLPKTPDASQVEHPMRSTYNTQGVTGETPELSIKVNHNSPYLLKKADGTFVDPVTGERLGFDHRFMGEGEGGQAHGWGSYFSVDDIRRYAIPAEGLYTYKGRNLAQLLFWKNDQNHFGTIAHIIEQMQKGVSVEDAIAAAYKSAKEILAGYKKNLNASSHLVEVEEDRVKMLENLDPEDFQSRGQQLHHYDVEIPEDNGENYLDEMKTIEKPLRRKIADAVRNLEGSPAPSVGYANYRNGWESLADMIERNQWAYLEVRDRLVQAFGGGWRAEKRLSEMMHDLGFVGVRYDGRRDGECYVIFNENDAKIINHREAMLTPNGTLYGWAVGDRIYLTKDGLNPNSPIHEYSHIWAKAMMRNNREGWQSIVDIFKGTPFWDEVVNDPNYQGLTTDDAICSEVLARYSGTRGAARMEEWAKEELYEAEQSGSLLRGAKVRQLINRAKKALADFWHWVGVNLFGIKHFDSAEQVADRVLFDMLNQTELGDVTGENAEAMISRYTPEQMRAIQEWNDAHPHPQYQVGEKLDHYAQRLSQWEEARKQFRASMSSAKHSAEEAEKADRLVAAGTPAFVPGVKPTPTADESPAEYALRLKQYYQLMRDENLVADYVAEINAQADAASKMLKKNTLVRGLLDAAKPIENFQEWMAQRGATMTDGSNAYTDTFLASGRVSQAHEQLTRDILRPLTKQVAKIIAPDEKTGKSRLDDINLTWQNMDVDGSGIKIDGKKITPIELVGLYCQAKDIAEAKELGLPDRGAAGFKKGTGMSHEDYITAFESRIPLEERDELWRLINAATHFALKYDYEAGRISEDTLNEYYKREFYVPQRGWRERSMSGIITAYEPVGKRADDPYNAALVTAHGRNSLAEDPFAYIMSIDASSIISSENNKIKQKFLRFCLDNEDLGLKTGAFRIKKYWIINVIDPETGRIKLDANGNPMMEVSYSAPSTEDLQHDKETKQQIQEKRKQLSKVRSAFEKQNEHGDMPETLQAAYETKIARLEQAIEDLENQMHIAWHATNTNISQRTSDEKKQHEVQVLLDGEKYVIELQDEKLANAINKKFKQHQESLFDTTQKMRNATRFMSAMLTQYNPEFAASNFARDYQVALATLMAEHRELVGPFMKYFATCQGAVWKYAFNDKVRDREAFANDEMGQYLREYFASGAPTGFSYMQDLKSLRRDFDAMVNESNVRRGIKGAVGVFAMLTEVSETAVRFAGFVAARKNGMGLNEAAYLSKELTTNFDRAGEVADTGWMAWFSFFRATLNGNLKFLKALKKMPLAYSLVAVSYFAMGMLNQFLNPDDPDDEIWASDYTRQSNFVLGKIRVPAAHFMRMFFGAGVNAAQWIQGNKTFGHAVYNTATFASNEMLPNYLNVLGNGTEWNSREGNVDFTFTGLIQGAMPSPVSPITDVWFNRDFRGATINREPFTKAQEGKKDILMGKEHTLPIYKWLTQAVYEGVGGSMNTEYKSSDPAWRSWLFDISPSCVEHVVEGYIPAGADMFITLGEAIYDAATGTPTGPDKWPFVRKFYNAYTPERAYNQQYYLLNGRVKEFERNLKDYQKNDPAQYRLLRNSQEYRTYQQTQSLVKSQSENPTTADVQALIEANKLWLK